MSSSKTADKPHRPAILTVFADRFATTKTEQSFALPDLARLIERTTAATKGDLPWLKMARFGDIRTEPDAGGKGGNSLRHNANVLAVTGVEADYDGEVVSVAEAVERLRAAELLALVYTSPRHSEDAPRWRVLCPTLLTWPPDRRDHYMARLNGVLGGIASGESWTLSQSYYYGSINRNPSHRVVLLPGWPIDLATELNAIAIGRPVKPEAATERPTELPGTPPAEITDARINGKVQSLLNNVAVARKPNKRRALISNGIALGGYLHFTNWSEQQAADALVEALHEEVEDWEYAKTLAAWAVKEGVDKPLPWMLPDRPYPGTAA